MPNKMFKLQDGKKSLELKMDFIVHMNLSVYIHSISFNLFILTKRTQIILIHLYI